MTTPFISTKLRLGDANSMMSQGGMQAAVTEKDSPTRHYLDAMGGGHFDNKPDLVRAMTEDGPEVVKWLEDLGVVCTRKGDGPIFLKNRTVPFFMTFIAEKPPLFFKEQLSSSPT